MRVLVDALAQPLGEAFKGVGAVEFLGAVLLGFDDKYALAGEAFVADGQEPFLHFCGQGAGGYVQAQVDGAGDLINVLAAAALGAHGSPFDAAHGQIEFGGNPQHRGQLRRLLLSVAAGGGLGEGQCH